MNSFNIFSWNIRQGGGSRIRQITDEIIDLSPDVIVLSEFRNNSSGLRLRSSLLAAGYLHQFVGHANSDVNTTGIFSRHNCGFRLHRQADKRYPAAIIEAIFPVFRLFGLYLPHKKKHVLFDYLLEQMKDQTPAILVGDFNSGRQFIDQAGDSFWYSDFFDRMESLGYKDAFRLLHGKKSEYSWFSRSGNGFRYDHTITHELLSPMVHSCSYIHKWRESGLSDHSPMIMTLATIK